MPGGSKLAHSGDTVGTPSLQGPTAAPASVCPPWLKAGSEGKGAGYPWPPGTQSSAPSPNPQGAKFAWESAGSGLEVCPEAIYGTQEIHVNGAVVLAFQLYYHTTQVRGHCAPQGHPPCRMTACLGLVLWSILEPGLHCWALRRVGLGEKCSQRWELESQAPWPLTCPLSSGLGALPRGWWLGCGQGCG